jgi:Spy/CpxP family protein refolding chaperone
MKYRFILGALVIGVLVISVVAQDDSDPQSESIDSVMAAVPTDTSAITAILATEPQVPLGPRDVLRNYEQGMAFVSHRTCAELAQIAQAAREGQISREQAEYVSGERYHLGMMQFQLLSTLYQIIQSEIENEVEQKDQSHIADGAAVVASPPPSTDIPKDMIKYLNLTQMQIAAIQTQIAEERGLVQPLVQQLATKRQALIAATLSGRFDANQVRNLAAEQSRILEQLITANVCLQTRIYKILTAEQQQKLDAMRQAAASTKPSFTDW